MMQHKNARRRWLMAVGLTALAGVTLTGTARAATPQFTESFVPDNCEFSSVGSNPFFILQPGYEQVYDGTEDGAKVHLVITVTAQTKKVAGAETRVVVERETHNGVLEEVSRNYFAVCKRNNSVFYFGEDVDMYAHGKISGHGGSWLAGVGGARPGVAMPGIALLGSRYAQEVAPGKAMDRAEIVSLSQSLNTPAGRFPKCLKTEETTPLEPGVKEYKLYAPGIGLVEDGTLKLVKVTRPKGLSGQAAAAALHDS